MRARLAALVFATLAPLGAAGCAQILGYNEPNQEAATKDDGGSGTPLDAGLPGAGTDGRIGDPGGGDGGLPGQLCADPPSFEPIVKYSVVPRPVALAVGDLNHDGRRDVVVASDMVSQFTVYDGSPAGQGALVSGAAVTASTPSGCMPGLSAIGVGDFDGDSFSDLVYAQANCPTGKLIVRRQNPLMPGQFLGEQVVGSVQPDGVGLSVADVNQDGKDDVVVLSMSSLQLLLGRADMPGQLTSAFTDPISSPGPKQGGAVLADLNGDGRLDIAWISQSGLQYKLQSGTTLGSFVGTSNLGAGNLVSFAVGDVNGDTLNDVVTVAPPLATVFLQSGSTHAFLQAGQVDIPAAGDVLRLVDVNSDGRLDLFSGGNGLLQCRAPAAPGSFGTNHPMTVLVMDRMPAFFFDLDGNGKVDALGLDQGAGLMSVAVQN